MKVLLIYPYPIEKRVYYPEDIQVPPIGMYYIGALLVENGYEVEILNLCEERDPVVIEKLLKEKKPDIIGFSVLNANRLGAVEIANIAKRINPKVKVIFGGVGATFLYHHLLKNFDCIDYIVIGEGEYTFLELIRSLESNEKDLSKIKGIAYKRDDEIIKTEEREFISNLNELPIPSKYFKYRHLCSSRGCPWNCVFCGSPKLWKRRIRLRSPKNFVEEIELLYKKGVNLFYFADDNLTIDKKRTIEICRDILERGLNISWYAISRVNYIDEEILYWMRMAGCIQISYGVESGSEKIRRRLNKPLKKQDIVRAFDLTKRYGILPRAYFIYGCPGETWDTINETIDLIYEIKPLSCLFYILDIFPGTELYERIKMFLNEDIWLNRIEGIMYWELDPHLDEQFILKAGERLRNAFYKGLPEFVDSICLVDNKELYSKHADFCSRLAMTFTHGDYSGIEAIPFKEQIAEKLYRMALKYAPNLRAYLGLGIMMQKKKEFEESVKLLKEGIQHFPQDEQLHICLGISYMNLGKIGEAISCFQKFPFSEQAKNYLLECKRLLNQI